MVIYWDLQYIDIYHLVGGFPGTWLFMTFHSVGNVIIPIDERIFFRGVETTNQIGMENHYNWGKSIGIGTND